MKALIFAVVLLAFSVGALLADTGKAPGKLGLGVVLGAPTGFAGKFWTGSRTAVDAALGFGDISLQATYLWHSWDVFPQPDEGRLPAYLGLGGRIKDTEDDTKAGLRTVAGVAYILPGDPVEVFIELAPVFNVAPKADVDIDGGIGLRYYFK